MDFPKEKNRPNAWTEDQKIFICVLRRWFCSVSEGQVMREVTPKELHTLFQGFSNVRLTAEAVTSMLHDMKSREHPVWVVVNRHWSFRSRDWKLENVKQQIRDIAESNGISLYEKCQESGRNRASDSTGKRKRRERPVSSDDTSVTDPNTASTSSEDDDGAFMIRTQSRSQKSNVQEKSIKVNREEKLPPHPLFYHLDRNGNRVLPFKRDSTYRYRSRTDGMLAFRCWESKPDKFKHQQKNLDIPNPVLSGLHGVNTSEGFWAGLDLGERQPPPSRNDQDRFGRTIFGHLRPLEESSPWISIWISLIAGVNRLLKTKSAVLSFIDLDLLGRIDTYKFPSVYPAGTVIHQYQLMKIPYPNGRHYGYNGTPEYIVWQHIPRSAVINSISHSSFQLHLTSNQDLKAVFDLDRLQRADSVQEYRNVGQVELPPKNELTGKSIGAFLAFARIPERFVKKAAIIAAENWKYGKTPGFEFELYLSGVESGYQSYRLAIHSLKSREGERKDFENEQDKFLTNRRFIQRVIGTTIFTEPAPGTLVMDNGAPISIVSNDPREDAIKEEQNEGYESSWTIVDDMDTVTISDTEDKDLEEYVAIKEKPISTGANSKKRICGDRNSADKRTARESPINNADSLDQYTYAPLDRDSGSAIAQRFGNTFIRSRQL